MSTKTANIITLTGFIIFVLGVGFLSSFFSGSAVKEIFIYLNKPVFAPPAWVFAPAWTILYILIGISAFLIWQKKDEKNIKPAIAIFFIQLFLNYIWSIIFFGSLNYFLALIDIGLLWVSILIMMIIFFKISKPASLILIPYFFWVSFASVLNYYVWILNPSVL